MLEILILYGLGKNIAEKAENQGRGGALFVIILIVLWFGGEFTAFFIALMVAHEPLWAYLWAWLGAAAGAILAYTFLAVLPLIESALSAKPRPRRRRRRPARERDDEDREERRRRRKSEKEDEPYDDFEVIEEKETGIQKEAPADYEVVEDDEPRPRRPKPRAESPRRRPREDD
jgi:hypothetical protein